MSLVRSCGASFSVYFAVSSLLSWVVTSYLVYALLGATNGFVNNTILAGMGKEGIDWYSVKMYWPLILIIVYIWKMQDIRQLFIWLELPGLTKRFLRRRE